MRPIDRDIGYNIRPDAKNVIFTAEHKKNISIGLKKYYSTHPGIMTGRKHSDATIEKIKNGNKGKKLSEETKEKISKNNKSGSPLVRIKLSISHMGNKHSEKSKKKIGEGSKKNWENEPLKEYYCEICNKRYSTRGRRAKYCSGACKSKAYRRNKKVKIEEHEPNKICKLCEKQYYSKLKRGQYCSAKCYQIDYRRK